MAETKATEAKAESKATAVAAGRQRMTADEAKKLGLDPSVYGKAK